MTSAVMKVKRNSIQKSADFGLENALARYVRTRWPKNTVCEVQREFDLSEGKARGVVYATAARGAINEILRHPNGGWRLGLILMEGVIGERLIDFITKERARLAEERQQAEETDRALAQMASRLFALPALDGDGADRVRGRGDREAPAPGRRVGGGSDHGAR